MSTSLMTIITPQFSCSLQVSSTVVVYHVSTNIVGFSSNMDWMQVTLNYLLKFLPSQVTKTLIPLLLKGNFHSICWKSILSFFSGYATTFFSSNSLILVDHCGLLVSYSVILSYSNINLAHWAWSNTTLSIDMAEVIFHLLKPYSISCNLTL